MKILPLIVIVAAISQPSFAMNKADLVEKMAKGTNAAGQQTSTRAKKPKEIVVVGSKVQKPTASTSAKPKPKPKPKPTHPSSGTGQPDISIPMN